MEELERSVDFATISSLPVSWFVSSFWWALATGFSILLANLLEKQVDLFLLFGQQGLLSVKLSPSLFDLRLDDACCWNCGLFLFIGSVASTTLIRDRLIDVRPIKAKLSDMRLNWLGRILYHKEYERRKLTRELSQRSTIWPCPQRKISRQLAIRSTPMI